MGSPLQSIAGVTEPTRVTGARRPVRTISVMTVDLITEDRQLWYLWFIVRVLDIVFGAQQILRIPAELAPPGSRRSVDRDRGRACVEQDHRIGDILEHIGACLIARAICFARIQSTRALLTEWG